MAATATASPLCSALMWGYARHPNFAGVLMVGLGCEVNQIDFLLEAYGIERGPLFQAMNIQDAGGTRKTVEAGIGKIREMLPSPTTARREPCPASELMVGAPVRRLGRLFRHHRQPGARLCLRPPGGAGRHRRARRDAGNLWRRAPPHPPRRERQGRPTS